MACRVFIIAALSALAWTANADTVAPGKVVAGERYKIVDGDTLRVAGYIIRLVGIDAPEWNQPCRDENGGIWACGRAAMAMLQNLLDASPTGVSCVIEGEDRYKRQLGVCYAGAAGVGTDVQRELVRAGLAVAEYDPRYRADEKRAESGKRGLWAGEFKRPKDWRADKRRKN